jgi:hypothetical protein
MTPTPVSTAEATAIATLENITHGDITPAAKALAAELTTD